jgi:hypothetical protein
LSARAAALGLGLLLVLAAVPGARANPSEDRILSLDRYTSAKGRQLGTTYSLWLKELNASIYHCMPWLEIAKEGLGFYRPRDGGRDDRYFSLRVYIEQDPSPVFSAMPLEGRASSMFSRYVGPLLRRMAANGALVREAALDGFSIVIEWLKQGVKGPGGRPIHETIAVFVEKAAALDYLDGRVQAGDLAARARVYGWDGETSLGQLRLTAWEDDFVRTHKVENYQLAAGVSCP